MRQLGWWFTALALLLCSFFLMRADVRWHHYDAVAEGSVLSVTRTSSSENDQDIYSVLVEYTPEGAATRTIRLYTTNPPSYGARVAVDYEAANPDEACMRGARAAPFGKWMLVFLLMPAMGLLFAFYRARADLRYLRILRDGRQTTAVFVSAHKEVSEDGETATEVRLRFTDEQNREYTFAHHTFAPARLQDDAREIVFYDAENPNRAVALDYMPGKLELRGDTFVTRKRLWPLFLGPIVTIAEAIWLAGAFLRS